MNLYFNTDSKNFVNSPTDFSPVSNVDFIFGSTESIDITLVNAANNGAYVLPPGNNLVLALKPSKSYLAGSYLAYGNASIVPNTGAGNFAYGITGFNLYTTGISGLLGLNDSITLAMELEYDNSGSGVVLSKPNTCTIYNSYINLDQVPFITGALEVYPAPGNIQTVSNLGATYPPLVSGKIPDSFLPPSLPIAWQYVFTDFNANAGYNYQVDTSFEAVLCTLPTGVPAMTYIQWQDATLTWNTNNFTISGNLINGVSGNFTGMLNGSKLGGVYISDDFGWSIK